jgi:hypothetical protein
MLPEEWPGAAEAAESASARRAGDRLATVRVDFFLHPGERLSEQERALMTAMLHSLVSDIADEIRAALPKGKAAANDEGNLALVEALSSARLLDRPSLVRLLLRRADEERIASAANARNGRREARVLQGLVSHEDGAIAAAAMALILARGKRRDRFGQGLLHFDDLRSDEAHALVHLICAGLRSEFASAAEGDRLLAAAADQLLARHDPASSVDALAGVLVALLRDQGALSDELIVAGAMEGEMTFVGQALATRSGVPAEVAMDELLSGHERRAMAMLRVAGVSRTVVASLLAGVGDLLGIPDPGRAINAFDKLSDALVEDTRTWLTTDAAYRAAVTALGSRHGKRTT